MTSIATDCERLTPADGLAFSNLYSIYVEAIPERERKTRDQIEGLLLRPDYQTLVIKADRELVGFSILFLPLNSPFFLLEYMAIKLSRRSHGFGSELLKRTFKAGFSDPNRSCCLIEVDRPCVGHPDRESQERRQRFYRSHGCLAVEGLSYVLPLPGATPPPAMDLMVRFPSPPAPLGRSLVEDWLRTLYMGVYGCPSSDRRIHEMLKTVSDPIRLI